MKCRTTIFEVRPWKRQRTYEGDKMNVLNRSIDLRLVPILVLSFMFGSCGSGSQTQADRQAVTPIAYVDSSGASFGAPEEVSKLKELMTSQLSASYSMNMKMSLGDGSDALGGGGGSNPPHCPGGSCQAQSSQGSCSVSCPVNTTPFCSPDWLQCQCLACA